MNAVKSTRRRSSGTRQALASQESSAYSSLLGLVGLGLLCGRGLGTSSSSASGLAGRWARGAGASPSCTFGSLSSVSVPPAASIFSRAVAEAPWTVIESFFESSPTPSSFTSLRIERIRPFAFSVSGVTSSPGLEAVEVADVHRLGVGAERPDRHRVVRGVAAQLREAHRERHLAALEAGAHHVRAGARLLALDAAARVAALARSPCRGRRACESLRGCAGLQVGEVRSFALATSDLLDLHEVAHLPKHACRSPGCRRARATCRSGRARARAACRGGAATARSRCPVWVSLSLGIAVSSPLRGFRLGNLLLGGRLRRRPAPAPPRRPRRAPAARRGRTCRARARRPRGGAGRAAPARRP